MAPDTILGVVLSESWHMGHLQQLPVVSFGMMNISSWSLENLKINKFLEEELHMRNGTCGEAVSEAHCDLLTLARRPMAALPPPGEDGSKDFGAGAARDLLKTLPDKSTP